MNKLLFKIKDRIDNVIDENKNIFKREDLEENGAIYYMNGENGTEFDYYVNNHLPCFMVFYNNKEKLGAIKVTLFNDGSLSIFIYGNNGKEKVTENKYNIETKKEDILNLAVILKKEADDINQFGVNIERINTDIIIKEETIDDFKNNSNYYIEFKNIKKLYNKVAFVSKKIFDEKYKIGYMYREKPTRDVDSGWRFFVGNETDEYINNITNVQLIEIGYIVNYDRVIQKYLNYKEGSSLIRVSCDEFEIDDGKKEVLIEKK